MTGRAAGIALSLRLVADSSFRGQRFVLPKDIKIQFTSQPGHLASVLEWAR